LAARNQWYSLHVCGAAVPTVSYCSFYVLTKFDRFQAVGAAILRQLAQDFFAQRYPPATAPRQVGPALRVAI
jgi:hypothetical protein